jgi:UDP-N-acetylmuramate--alanine ligase
VDRRFQQRGQARGVTVVDDYGHHPTEIRATLEAARASMLDSARLDSALDSVRASISATRRGKIHVIFQPHRYTRTKDLLDEFGDAFRDADTVVVLPIYAASEEPIAGVTAELLAERIQGPNAAFAPDFAAAVQAVAAAAHEGDLILTLGAGSVSQLAPQILAALAAE